jgi:6-methylsalicylic acid synthase
VDYARGNPVAVVGIGCRFAGGITTVHQFWDLLVGARSVVGQAPADRWSEYAERGAQAKRIIEQATRPGAFIDDIAGFDAAFFGIAPAEAQSMDPQHRLALECAWEALQHGGIDSAELAGTDAGVYAGIGSDDYGRRLLEDLPSITAWTGIGASMCGAANRISHALDLRGPSIAIDTACSSSLVAIHQAVSALRHDGIPLAIAGGVMLMAGPGLTVSLGQAGVLAPDGRSKSFDAAADGYGRGEGGAFVVLQRLDDALAAGRRVLAVVRGGAVRQDGRTNGIMTPSGSAQQHLMRSAYAAAGVDPATVAYVEAHGTGTRAGDPQEALALGAVLGSGREGTDSCLIGSVKPNIGHLEAGAGAAGFIKAVLALHHRLIPPTAVTTSATSALDWDAAGLRLVTEPTPWPASQTPARAAVASYGYGGTLCHLVLEAAPPVASTSGRNDRALLVAAVSAASGSGLGAEIDALRAWLGEHPDVAIDDICYTLARRRTHLPYRAAVIAADRTELAAALCEQPDAYRARDPHDAVWVFSGHGAQWTGMGTELLAAEPRFASPIAQVSDIFRAEFGCSAEELLRNGDFSHVPTAQCAIFLVQIGLAALWRAEGLRPAAVIGHSVGEIAAAVVAGALDVRDGARLICRRSTLLEAAVGNGAMVIVAGRFGEVAAELSNESDAVTAIESSFDSTVVSGSVEAIARITDRWQAEDRMVRRIDTDVAFHSPHMAAIADRLACAAAGIPCTQPRIPLYTTALDDPRDNRPRDARYWATNLAAPVRFASAVTAVIDDGHRSFLEVSAHPVVAHSIGEIDPTVTVAHSLRRRKPSVRTIMENFAELHRAGVRIDWRQMYPAGHLVDLPTTRWQRTRFWASTPPVTADFGHDPASHTLLGQLSTTVNVHPSVQVWQTRLDYANRPYPGDHPVNGSEIVPAAILLNTFAVAAPNQVLGDVALRVPVTLSPSRHIQIAVTEDRLTLSSRIDGDWQTHTTARTLRSDARRFGRRSPVLWYRGESLPADCVIDRLAALGVTSMGLSWQITELERSELGMSARVKGSGADSWATYVDAALSAGAVAFAGPKALRMPASIDEVWVPASAPPTEVILTVTLRPAFTADIEISDSTGRAHVYLYGVRYSEPEFDTIDGARTYELTWQPWEMASTTEVGAVTVVGADPALRAESLSGIGDIGVTVLAPRQRAGEPVSAATERMVAELFGAAQELSGRLWCVTRGARTPRDESGLAQTALWGAARALLAEFPQTFAGIVDLPADAGPSDFAVLTRILGTAPGTDEDVLAIENGQVLRLRAGAERQPRVLTEGGPRCRPAGTYAVIGATGALGAITALWLAERGARRLILIGRSEPADRRSNPLRRALEARGVTVHTVAADVTDRVSLTTALDTESRGLPPIRGIVHAAGSVDNMLVRQVRGPRIGEGLAAKVGGSMLLHELFAPDELDFLVLFSSAGQLLHLPGQPVYSAANAFVDGFARFRRELGDAGCQSIAWTSWRGLGMSTSSTAIDAELAMHGTGDITATDALREWGALEPASGPNVAILRVVPGGTVPPILAEVAARIPVATTPFDWHALAADERREYLSDTIQSIAATVLGASAADVPRERPLTEIGFDSLLSTTLRRDLGDRIGVGVAANLLWHHPSIDALAKALAESVPKEHTQ